MPIRTILALALVLALAFSASADEGCVPTTSAPEIDTGETPAGRFYVENDMCQPGCPWTVHVYEETNGIDGLQRDDYWGDDTCGLFPADRIVRAIGDGQ